MKLATHATSPDYAALRQISSPHDARYDVLRLERARAIYGALYQRMQDALHLSDEGYELTITVSSPSKTMKLTSAEADACFNLSEVYQLLGDQMNELSQNILSTLAGEPHPLTKDPLPGPFEGTNDPLMIQAHELCMPQAAMPAEVPAPTAPRAACAA